MSDGTIETGSEATDSAASGNGTATEASGAGDGKPSSDYLERIGSDRSFAQAEVRKHQGRADKAEQELKSMREWMGSLNRYQPQYQGDALAMALDDYVKIVNDPQMASAITSWRQTGKIETTPSASAEDEDYTTPEEKKIAALEARLAQYEQRIVSQEVGTGRTALTRHLERFYESMPVSPEARKRIDGELSKNIQTWASGGELGRKALDALAGESGMKTVRTIALGMLSDEEIHQAQKNAALRKGQRLGGLATDVPGSASGAGRDIPEDVKRDPIKAFEWAMAHPERHTSE